MEIFEAQVQYPSMSVSQTTVRQWNTYHSQGGPDCKSSFPFPFAPYAVGKAAAVQGRTSLTGGEIAFKTSHIRRGVAAKSTDASSKKSQCSLAKLSRDHQSRKMRRLQNTVTFTTNCLLRVIRGLHFSRTLWSLTSEKKRQKKKKRNLRQSLSPVSSYPNLLVLLDNRLWIQRPCGT